MTRQVKCVLGQALLPWWKPHSHILHFCCIMNIFSSPNITTFLHINLHICTRAANREYCLKQRFSHWGHWWAEGDVAKILHERKEKSRCEFSKHGFIKETKNLKQDCDPTWFYWKFSTILDEYRNVTNHIPKFNTHVKEPNQLKHSWTRSQP